MSQYNVGTITLTNGDETVTGSGTEWLTEASAGDWLIRVGEGISYQVGSITDDDELELTAPYAGASGTGVDYVLVRDFTANQGYPVVKKGDVETAAIIERAMTMVDADVAGAGGAAALTGTSTSSVAVGTGSKSFTTQTGKLFAAGRLVTITDDAAPSTNWMFGQVTAYSGTALTVNVLVVGGGGTLDAWTIALSGARGATGAQGEQGDPGVDGDPGDPIVWRGDWADAASYALLDAVAADGASYICTDPHTAGASTEPGVGVDWATVWDLMAAAGVDGTDGADGLGVPAGGATGQVLAKVSSADNDTAWVDPAAGGGGGYNPILDGALSSKGKSETSFADDVYDLDAWYVLTQSNAVAGSVLTDVEDGTPFMARLSQSNASAQRMGRAQIIKARDCKHLRGQQVTFRFGRFRCSSAQAIRFALLEWTGTEDAVTSDVVADWTNGAFTAGNFFLGSNLTISGVAATTPSANTLTDGPSITATLGSSFNNLIVIAWTEGTAAQNVTLDLGKAQIDLGATAQPFRPEPTGVNNPRILEHFRVLGGDTLARYGAARTTGTSAGELIFNLVPPMFRAPTATVNNPTSWSVNDASVNAAVSSVVSTQITRDAFNLNVACATVTALRPAFFTPNNANGTIYLAAQM